MSRLAQQWASLKEDPFRYFDVLSVKWRGIDFNILKEDAKMRKVVFWFSVLLTGVWAIMGFDSGTGQVEWPLIYIFGNLIKGKPVTWQGISYWYHWAYGKYMHWSAFVIYGFAFAFLSKYLYDKLHIQGSQNIGYTFATVLFSVSIFEFYWMLSYFFWQGQVWILKWQWPQLRILVQNTAFFLMGLFLLYHVQFETFLKPRIDLKTVLSISLAIGSCLLWWYYPWRVQPLTVQTTNGLWTNNNHFPQTTYTIDLDPFDGYNAGEQFYLEDNLVHLVNTLAKIFVTVAVVSVGCLVPKKGEEWRGEK